MKYTAIYEKVKSAKRISIDEVSVYDPFLK